MNKILIISMDNLFATPYIKNYLENLEDKIVDVISWNRRNIDEQSLNFNEHFIFDDNGKKNIVSYIKFRYFIINKLKKNSYNKIIILHSPVGILIADTLKKFKNNFILDIRDFTFEKYNLYNIIQNKNIRLSYATIISSEGFKTFLPKNNYIICHNNSVLLNEKKEDYEKKEFKKKEIIISQVGNIRFYDETKKFIENSRNFNELKLKYIGSGASNLSNITKDIIIEDYFDQNETLLKYSDADFINNLYGNGNENVRYALSNKLYIACFLEIPILVSPNTYMSEIANKYNLGLEVDFNDEKSVGRIIDFYKDIDLKVFKKGCEEFLNRVNKENEDFNQLVRKFGNQ